VNDHGCGIPLDKKESLLAPFFSTKREGTGLGLPTAKKIVEEHRGHMEVADNLEKGIIQKPVILSLSDTIVHSVVVYSLPF
jgi:signal transduction histidine kinase